MTEKRKQIDAPPGSLFCIIYVKKQGANTTSLINTSRQRVAVHPPGHLSSLERNASLAPRSPVYTRARHAQCSRADSALRGANGPVRVREY